MINRYTAVFIVALLALPASAKASDDGRYQLEVGPPVVVLDTRTGELWVGVSHPTETLVLRPGRYQDDDGALRSLPPQRSD